MLTSMTTSALVMGLLGGPHCVAMCGAACAGIARSAGAGSTWALWKFQLSRLLAPQQARERAADPIKAAATQRRQWLGCAVGTVVGIGSGWAGMIAGLIASGRL